MPLDPQDSKPKQALQHQASPPAKGSSQRAATPEESKQELDDAIQGSKEILATATTALPIFPDTVTIDRAKLTVTKRRFFGAAAVMSIRIEDVVNVTNTVGPIFGSITIVSRVMNSRPYTIGNLWRKDALRLKRIAQGYIIALERQIDCSVLEVDELSKKLFELGEDAHSV